jgi:hypothetical protein
MRMSSFSRTAIVFSMMLGATAAGKPPEVPAGVQSEFRVLPAAAAEFFQDDPAIVPGIYVPAPNASSDGEIIRAGFNSLIGGDRGFDLFAPFYLIRPRLAREAFAMAELHWQANDTEEALRWYRGLTELFPGSVYAARAAERIEQLQLLRIVAEAGEPQSEEPPLAAEPLLTMPRIANP